MNNNSNQDNNGGKMPRNGGQTIMILVVAAIITFISAYFMKNMILGSSTEELTYDRFITMVESGQVESVVAGSSEDGKR